MLVILLNTLTMLTLHDIKVTYDMERLVMVRDKYRVYHSCNTIVGSGSKTAQYDLQFHFQSFSNIATPNVNLTLSNFYS